MITIKVILEDDELDKSVTGEMPISHIQDMRDKFGLDAVKSLVDSLLRELDEIEECE